MKYKRINTNIIRNNGTIDILSVFRTLFMFLIFLEHYPDAPLKVGGKAVCFFFVLSGFVLSYGYGDKLSNRSLTYKDFLFGRMIKLYPLHWILLPIGFYITREVFLQTVKYLPANFLLCQSLIPDQFCYYSGNGVSWFLSTIVFLYIVFPLLWRICSRLAIRWNIALYALLIIIRYSLEIELPEDIKTDWLYINPLTRWMDFTCGIITYLLYKKLKDADVIIKNKSLLIGIWPFIVTFPITVFIITHNRTYSLVIFWIAYSLLIGGSSLLEMYVGKDMKRHHPKLMRIISSFSSIMFSFYLLHQIVILVLYNHPPINCLDNKFMKFLLILGMCVLLAFISHNYFEKPAAAYMKKVWKNTKNSH